VRDKSRIKCQIIKDYVRKLIENSQLIFDLAICIFEFLTNVIFSQNSLGTLFLSEQSIKGEFFILMAIVSLG
jgi:hypothetical protein